MGSVKPKMPPYGLGWRTRAAEVLTYADVWATMETAGAGGRELGRRFTDSAGSRPDERAGQQAGETGAGWLQV